MSVYSPVEARRLSQPEKLAEGDIFLTKSRVTSLKQMIAAGLPARMQAKWNVVLAADNTRIPQPLDPFYTPAHYNDEEGAADAIAMMRADLEPAVDLAIRWKMLRNPEDAAAVVRILTAWTKISSFNVSNNERLNWANKWTMAIQAAMLVADSPAYSAVFEATFKTFCVSMMNLYQPEFTMSDNRNMWGTAHRMAVAALTRDEELLRSAIHSWRFSLSDSLRANVLVNEVYREGSTTGNGSTGLHYCNYYMAAAVTAAEIARFCGEWLYDYVTPDGSTLKGCWDKVSYWTANPALFPYNTSGTPSTTTRVWCHVDPLHALWPNASSTTLISLYTVTQDYYGFRGGILAYQGRPLYG